MVGFVGSCDWWVVVFERYFEIRLINMKNLFIGFISYFYYVLKDGVIFYKIKFLFEIKIYCF